MATAQYYAWDKAGRPLEPCRPVREIVERMRVAFPKAAAAHLFSWYADDAHYQANRPQDHTPYSYTPWPITPNPYPVVFATDIMHRPDLGVNCFTLFDYWIAEARAGRTPWLKYMVWQGRSYDVRTGWVPKSATGHYDHIHISTRTDHRNTSLGSWVLVPGASEGDDVPLYWKSSAAQPVTGDHVTDVQQDLVGLGLVVDGSLYGEGDADGKHGPRTAKALMLGIAPWVGGDPSGFTMGPGERRELKKAVARKQAGTGGGLTVTQVEQIAERVAEQEIAETKVTVTLDPTE